jgi:transcriptional regulator of aromatic amino acid metabolism
MSIELCDRCGANPATVAMASDGPHLAGEALLASMPQPVVSAADATRDMADAPRAALLASREETLRTNSAETALLQAQLHNLTRQAHACMGEFRQNMHGRITGGRKEIAERFEAL